MSDDSSIQTDEHEAEADEGMEALLKRFAPEDPEDGQEATEEPEADTEEPSDDPEGETEEAAEETEASDEATVKIKVGDKEEKVKVSDLKRLWGQEASLTQKSQVLADATKRATDEGEKAVSILSALVTKAEKDFEQYRGVDLPLAAQRLEERAYRQLKADMEGSWNNLQFLKQEGTALLQTVQQNRAMDHRQMMATVDTEMAKVVPGWTADSRKEVVEYAKSQGLPAAMAEGLADPAAVILVRKAMLFDRGTKAVESKVKPVAASAPGKTTKPGAARATDTSTDKRRAAMTKLRSSGSVDDAANAFLARFG